MTKVLLNHPDDEALRALSLGQLTEAELAHVSAHLGDCAECCHRIDQLATVDRLLVRLQKGAAYWDEALVRPAQRRSAVRALRQAHQARSASQIQDPEVSTLSGIASAAAVQTHRDMPTTKGRPDEWTGFLAPPQQPDEIGRLGPYRILTVLGQGGMGVVFRAHDPSLDRLVALKVMLPGMAAVSTATERFLREAKAAAGLKHPHVVTIFQVGEDRGVPFLAMELLEGESLADRIRREGQLPLAELLRIGRETALGLAAAHDRGLVHRDIKSANLWLEGPTGHVKILDFGLARAQADQTHLTQQGLIVGTPEYMAPEQAEGKPLDQRCDLFSLGCVLYEMCIGTAPFHRETTIAVLRALALHEPPAVDEVRPDAPPELSSLLVRLLSKQPQDRPASAQEVVETLHALEQLPPRAILPKPVARPSRRSRKPRLAVGLAVAVLSMVLASIVVLWQTPRGTVRIESDDPAVEVVFDKDGPTIKGVDKEPITLRAGEHGLRIRRGDFTFDADKLVLKKGAALTLKVELLQGKVQVMQDGQVVATQDIPLPVRVPDEAWFKKVRALPPEEQDEEVAAKLKDFNPGFDGQVIRKLEDIGARFELVTDHVTNFTPLRALTGVSVLSCAGSNRGKGHMVDPETLRGLRLIGLCCLYTNVTDLAPLAGMKLIYLDCQGTKVADLEPLRGMPMQFLYCLNCPGIKSLAPLEGMPLTHFHCAATRVSDLAPLRGMKLEHFWFAATRVKDLAPLRGMPLKILDFRSTAVSDLTPLQGMQLTELHCEQTKVTDLSVLRGMPLTILSCDFQAERDAAILRSIKTLQQINGKSATAFWKEVDARQEMQKP